MLSSRTLFAFPTIVGLTACFGSGAVIASKVESSGESFDFFAVNWAKAVAAASGMEISARGVEFIDRKRTFVIVSNHQSHLDTIALYVTCPVPIRMLAKASLFKIPIFGPSLKAGGHIKIYRDKEKRTDFDRLLEEVDSLKRTGRSVVVFSEGTRSLDGTFGSFKMGAFTIAERFGLPILPVAIKGTREVLPAKKIEFHPGPVSIEYLLPFESTGMTAVELRDKTHAMIAGVLAR